MLMVTIILPSCPARLHNVLNRFLYLFTAYGELLRGGRSARSTLAEKTGSGKNRHNKPDSAHLGLDPVRTGS